MAGPRVTRFERRPASKQKAKWVWDGAFALRDVPPLWMLMVPCRTRYRGKTTTTTKWIIGMSEDESDTIEIDGPARQVYDRLLEMMREMA
jgi:hypothetical protein